MKRKYYLRKSILTLFSVLLVVIITGLLTTKQLSERSLANLISSQMLELELIKDRIANEIEKFDAVAYSIAHSPRMSNLESLIKKENFDVIYETLDRYKLAFNASVCYILDTNGNCIASSNRFDSDSFEGNNYSHRQYFKEALKGKKGRLISLGVTSYKRGYYSSYPIVDNNANIIGVLAVKADFENLENYLQMPLTFFVDNNGVIFLSSNKSLLYSTIAPIDYSKCDSSVLFSLYKRSTFNNLFEVTPNFSDPIIYNDTEYKYLNIEGIDNQWQIVRLLDVESASSIKTIGLLSILIVCFIIIAIFKIFDDYFKSVRRTKQKVEELGFIVDFLPDAAFVINKTGNILAWNRQIEKYTGVNSKEMLNKGDHQYSVPIYGERKKMLIDYLGMPLEQVRKVYPNAEKDGQTLITETEIIFPSGDQKTLWLKAGFIYNADNEIIASIEVFRDITEKKKAEIEKTKLISQLKELNNNLEEVITEKDSLIEKLEQAKNSLSELNSEKDKFFSIMSHDLRSPLSGIIGLSELLLSDFHEMSVQKKLEYLKNIFTTSTNVFDLLENLLQWSKVQRKGVNIKMEKLNLKEVLDSNINLVKSQLAEKHQEAYNLVDKDINVCCDKNLLDLIIRNLLSNAIKFTPKKGSIFFRTTFDDNLKHIILKIHDTGIGIPKEFMDNLFALSTAASRKGTEGEPSTGLGLVLCKEFIELMNGKISVESEVGKGSVFTLYILNNNCL